MTNDIETIIVATKTRMQSTLENLKQEISSIRTGRINTNLLDKIQVEYYGSMLPINQVATVNIIEPSTLIITPFDKQAIKNIEIAILKSELKINPNNDGNIIKLPIPALTEERRKELTRIVNRIGEETKTAARNIRRNANDDIKKLKKNKDVSLSEDISKKTLDLIQKMTDETVRDIDEIVQRKENDIMFI